MKTLPALIVGCSLQCRIKLTKFIRLVHLWIARSHPIAIIVTAGAVETAPFITLDSKANTAKS